MLDPSWIGPGETPDGKWHHLSWVGNTSSQYHVHLDGVKETTLRHRPSHRDLWRIMDQRFGRFASIKRRLYRFPAPEKDALSYSREVLADSPLAYYRLGDGSMRDSSGNGRHGEWIDPV